MLSTLGSFVRVVLDCVKTALRRCAGAFGQF
jgi:hypothetical protein